jgi:hypothetical protein
MTAKLEEALRERFAQLKLDIERDQRLADEFKEKTGLRTAEHKRYHEKMQERVQIEWYRFDEHQCLATMAGIDLKGGEKHSQTQPSEASGAIAIKTTTKGELG